MLSPVAPADSFREDIRTGVAESMALLRSWIVALPPTRHEGEQISGGSSSRDREDVGRSGRSERHRQSGDRTVAGPSRAFPNRWSILASEAGFIPYEQTKRHARIFFLDNLFDTLVENSEDSDSDENDEGQDSDGYVDADEDGEEEEEKIECGVCFENLPRILGMHLDPCQHWLCMSCITGHVCAKISERRFPVFCPLCMADRTNANPSQISGALVQRLDMSEEQYAVWAEMEMAQLSIPVHCRKCSQYAFVDKSDYDHLDKMTCPFPGCDHTWCKNCQQEITSNGAKHTCDGSLEFKHLMKQMGWKYCPRCKTPIQKTEGCNHMTVSFPHYSQVGTGDRCQLTGCFPPCPVCDARVQLALLLQVRQTDCGNVSENIVVCDYGGILSMLSVM
ncbi:hypothetical protein SCLCIDRAFT_1123734 [Scleroderma citrinum Foug A]|uniref:RING-type domain-containing protein n=1 Tax=Scleroderma citrinum Foug A TaxID=1036808 RepID=A0A0C3DAF7_9AGAM|nr:hypothetical protein SCLCIDRAFT_1123734 [Scleroderma citrinum Foug A]